MGETAAEVKARLTIETDGEPETFTKTADAVQQLADGAAAADSPVAQLADHLSGLAQGADELGPARDNVLAFASAMKEAAATDDVEQQRAAVERAGEAWRKFAEDAKAANQLTEDQVKQLDESLKALEETEKRLAAPLQEGAKEASEAMDRLRKSIESGFQGADRRAGDARRRIEEYSRALDAARKSGQNVTGGQQEELRRLEAEYRKCVEEIGRFKNAQKDAQEEIKHTSAELDGQVGSINSLGDIAEKASPKLGKIVGVGAAIVGAFTAGYAAGEKLRSIINSLTDDALDRFLQKAFLMQDWADRLVGTVDDIGATQQLLANQRNLFENLGLSGFSGDLEKNAAILDEHRKKLHASTAEFYEWSKALNLDRGELEKSARQLSKFVEQLFTANSSISKADVSSVVKNQVRDLLDAFQRLGIVAPESLRLMAQSLGIVSSEGEKVKKILEEIKGVSVLTSDQLKKEAAQVEAAFSKIRIQGLSTEQYERAKKVLQELVDKFTLAGERIPAELARMAAGYHIFQNESALAVQAVRDFAPAAESAAGGMGTLESGTKSLSGAVKDLADNMAKVPAGVPALIAAHESAAKAEDNHAKAAKTLFEQLEETAAAAAAIPSLIAAHAAAEKEATERSTEAVKQKAAATVLLVAADGHRVVTNQAVAESEKSAGAETEKAAVAAATTTRLVEQVVDGKVHQVITNRELAESEAKAAAAADSAGQAATKAAGGYDQAKNSASAAAVATADSGKAAGGAAKEIDSAKQSVDGFQSALNGLVSGGATFVRTMARLIGMAGQIVAALRGIGTQAAGFSNPVIIELDRIIKKAGEVEAALRKVTKK